MLTSEILTAARALIDTPAKWGRGMEVIYRNEKRCAGFAICAAAGSTGGVSAAIRALSGGSPLTIGSWNDERTHADILNAFDRAIAAELARESANG